MGFKNMLKSCTGVVTVFNILSIILMLSIFSFTLNMRLEFTGTSPLLNSLSIVKSINQDEIILNPGSKDSTMENLVNISLESRKDNQIQSAKPNLTKYNITIDSNFTSLEGFKELTGNSCPSLKHCSLWRKGFIKGGLWTNSTNGNPSFFNPFNCWWYNFPSIREYRPKSFISRSTTRKRKAIFINGLTDLEIFRQVVASNQDEFIYMNEQLPDSSDKLTLLVDKIKGLIGKDTEMFVVTNWQSKRKPVLYSVLSKLREALQPMLSQLLWTNVPFKTTSTLDDIIAGNQRMLLEFMRHNAEDIVYFDLFGPSLFSPETILNPSNSSELVGYLRNAALNFLFKQEILESSKFKGKDHICEPSDSCSSCFMVHSRMPSSRITPKLLAHYFTRHGTPTVITLKNKDRIWNGTWESLIQTNSNATVTTRIDYKWVKTRHFKSIPLKRYLKLVHIYPRKDAYSDSTNASKELPLYAGNNKLSPDAMKRFQFKYPKWFTRDSLQRPALWLGPKDSVSSLHVDHSNQGKVAYQVLGSKLWHLFSPQTIQFCYTHKVGPVVWSNIPDPREYSAKRAKSFPLFKFALPNSLYVHVKENELLYNPDGWGHAVYNTDSSLMLNFWLRTGRLTMKPETSISGQSTSISSTIK